jgi:hypothetical protein
VTFDLAALSWKDGLLIGVIIGQWMNARARRDQGRRIGDLERALARALRLDDSEKHEVPSEHGRPR